MNATRRFSIAGPWINDGSLPPHWEELVDPETGKSYFVDHALKITSWVDPRDLFMKPEVFEECADGGFALGWERAVDAVHGEYFVDHNTWTTTFKDPRLPPAERLKSPLIAHDLLDESIGPVRILSRKLCAVHLTALAFHGSQAAAVSTCASHLNAINIRFFFLVFFSSRAQINIMILAVELLRTSSAPPVQCHTAL